MHIAPLKVIWGSVLTDGLVSPRRGKYDILMESTSNILSSLPNNIGIMIKLRHQLVRGS